MFASEAIKKNFRFMTLQVRKQLERTLHLLAEPAPDDIKAIADSDDYIDSLKSMIENDCFAYLANEKVRDERVVDALRALSVITSNLERLADFSVNIARQSQRLGGARTLSRFGYRAYFELVLEGVGLIDSALLNRDSAQALQICHIENALDRLYGADLEQIMESLRTGREVENHITVLFILHYLERMGDALQNIGEAIIFAVLGERLKIEQYRVLEDAIDGGVTNGGTLDEVELDGIWGTRSGVRIGTVQDSDEASASQKVLFKEGNPEKLQAEKDSLHRWEQIVPGLAPRVVEYEQQGQDAALLLQYLDGVTFQELVVNAQPEVVERALSRICATLQHVWGLTRVPAPVSGKYLGQLMSRMDDVYRVHPDLRRGAVRIGELVAPPLSDLLDFARRVDVELAAPFAVYIHGDFNLDNIIYNRAADSLHFVDVHRSREMDYVQDVSVFLVSGFRLPVFVPRVRRTLEYVAQRFLRFARSYADEQGDRIFEARLALGLTRSLITSTRFELNRAFARAMYARAEYLLRRLRAHSDQGWEHFTVPDSVLVY